jgi:hypothetical protein
LRCGNCHMPKFDVDFLLTRNLAVTAMANVTKCFPGECHAYVNAIHFVVGGEIIAETDRRKIDGIANWKTVSLDDLK